MLLGFAGMAVQECFVGEELSHHDTLFLLHTERRMPLNRLQGLRERFQQKTLSQEMAAPGRKMLDTFKRDYLSRGQTDKADGTCGEGDPENSITQSEDAAEGQR
ncbi:hypothetical protein H671_1g2927 [Cricetulus griseus]|nr:hypothetical protein H671_1g2927 [Cricetulus griseus]